MSFITYGNQATVKMCEKVESLLSLYHTHGFPSENNQFSEDGITIEILDSIRVSTDLMSMNFTPKNGDTTQWDVDISNKTHQCQFSNTTPYAFTEQDVKLILSCATTLDVTKGAILNAFERLKEESVLTL